MRTLTEKYNGVLKGLFSKDQFIVDARREQSSLVTQHNSYQDAVSILLRKGLISELVEELPAKKEISIKEEEAVEEKKLTPAEKAGKEKIIKGLKKSGMSKDDPSTYAIATAKAKELYEIRGGDDNPALGTIAQSNNRTFKVPTQKGTLHIEVEEDPAGVFVDVIFNHVDLTTTDIQFPSGIVKITQRQKLIKLNKSANESELKEGYKVSKHAVEVRNLKKGDIFPSGVEVVSVSSGATTPSGKMDLTIKYPNGKQQTVQWGKYTKVALKRVPTPQEELETLKRIWSQVPQEEWSDSLKSKIADLESKAGNMQEGLDQVQSAVDSVKALIKKHARALNDNDAYEFHEQLKAFFNRLFEGDIKEGASLSRNDEIEHIPSGVTLRVSVVRQDRISGTITNPGTVKGKELKLGDVAFIRPIEMGVVWRKIEKPKEEPTYANLSEAKEEYKTPKPELPLDVLHHGIRFELEKKGILGTPTEEEYMKAFKAASKCLEKDLLHYKKEEGATEAPSSKSDEMVKVKLKEGFKNIIRKMLSEDNSKTNRPFNIKGQVL